MPAMAMRSAKSVALIVVGSVVLSLNGCGTKPKKTFLSVQTARIETATFSTVIEAISPLESTSNVAVKPQIDGTVVQILATAGQQVKAGQVILVLDNVQQSAALDAARSEASKTILNAERYAYLYAQGAISAKERDLYANEAVQAKDEARSDAAELGFKFVRAPIDGVIGDLDSVKLGDYVKTGQTITGIVDNSILWTLMDIPASEASAVRVGQTVKLVSQTTPPVSGEGKVTFVSPYYAVSSSSNAPNTLRVKAEFPKLTGQLKTGQYVASTIITSRQNSLSVPVQAVMMQAQQPFVYRVVPLNKALPKIKASPNASEQAVKKLERLPGDTPIVVQTKVQLGNLQNNAYPVKAGLNAGDQVAISNTSRLRSGMPVQVKTVQVKSGAN